MHTCVKNMDPEAKLGCSHENSVKWNAEGYSGRAEYQGGYVFA